MSAERNIDIPNNFNTFNLAVLDFGIAGGPKVPKNTQSDSDG